MSTTEMSTDLSHDLVLKTKAQVPKINVDVAQLLKRYADMLEQQSAVFFRHQAYRKAAMTIGELEEPIDQLLERDGREGLTALPTIGVSIASAIVEIVMTGHWTQLDRIAGDWVVVIYQADGHPEGRCTVITAASGKNNGQRRVRGIRSDVAI